MRQRRHSKHTCDRKNEDGLAAFSWRGVGESSQKILPMPVPAHAVVVEKSKRRMDEENLSPCWDLPMRMVGLKVCSSILMLSSLVRTSRLPTCSGKQGSHSAFLNFASFRTDQLGGHAPGTLCSVLHTEYVLQSLYVTQVEFCSLTSQSWRREL